MSHINELIKKHCPDGVEFKHLQEVARITRGVRVTKRDLLLDGEYPVVSGGIGYMGYINDWNRESETITIAQYGSAGYVNWQAQRFWANDVCFSVIPNEELIDNRFLYYLLSNKQKYLYEISNRNAVPNSIDREKILSTRIPVPNIAIQQEIVKRLDTFSKLEAELKAELKARNIQYAFYRDLLIAAFQGSSVPMGRVGSFKRGRRFTKNDVVADGIPSMHYGEIYTHYGVSAETALTYVRSDLLKQLCFAQPGDVVIATVGETVEEVAKAVAWLGSEPIAIHDDTAFFRSEENPKYISYVMQTADFHSQKNKHVARGKVKRLSGDGLSKIRIPVPPRKEQDRIVGILDKFDTLVNDLSAGLPGELRAHRQQYVHYRARLLTFQEAV